MKKILGTKLNNKGSGIVTVMVAIMFLSVFGSLLLMTSFSGFEMKTSDRKGKQNFYDAETAMGEILTGLQDVASDSIGNSLKSSLPQFSAGTNAAQIDFSKNFRESIKDWSVSDNKGKKISLITIDEDAKHGTYNPDAIACLVKNCREGDISVNVKAEDGKSDKEITVQSGNKVGVHYDGKYAPAVEFKYSTEEGKEDLIESVTFKDITVTYENEGRASTITTDILVTIPDVVSDITDTGSNNIEDYVLIAGGALKDNNNSGIASKVIGHSYMSALNTFGDGSISFGYGPEDSYDTQYKTVVKNDITVRGNSGDNDRVTFNNTSLLYAGDIVLKDSSKISLLGDTFVADDLDFNGYNCSAVIRGKYTGFGDDTLNPDASSAILFNGMKSGFDILGAEEINLYGYSFINGTYTKQEAVEGSEELQSVIVGNNVKMGESISVRANQAAYLIDKDSLTYTDTGKPLTSNPIVVNDPDNIRDVVLDSEIIIPGFEVLPEREKRTYSDYNAEVQRVVMPYGNGQAIVYYFVRIENIADANDYFYNYYTASVRGLENRINTTSDDAERARLKKEKNEIEKYVSRYIDLSDGRTFIGSGKGDKTNYDISGDWFKYYEQTVNGSKSDIFEIRKGTAKTRDNPFKDIFKYLCKFLTNSKPTDIADYGITEEDWKSDNFTPFDYWVKTSEFVDRDGNKLFNDNIEFKDSSDKVVAVVANKDYTFTSGSDVNLIVCNGNVTIDSGAEFSGLIFCSGNVTLNGSATLECSPQKLKNAYKAKSATDTTVNKYFNKPLYSQIDPEESASGSSSSLLSLVRYSNWRKG